MMMIGQIGPAAPVAKSQRANTDLVQGPEVPTTREGVEITTDMTSQGTYFHLNFIFLYNFPVLFNFG